MRVPIQLEVHQETDSEFLCLHEKRERGRSNCGKGKQQSYMKVLQSSLFVCFDLGFTLEWEFLLDQKFCPTPQRWFWKLLEQLLWQWILTKEAWASREQLWWLEVADIHDGVTVLFVCFNPGCTLSTYQIWSSVLLPKGDFEEHWNNLPKQSTVNFFTCTRNGSEWEAIVSNGSNRYIIWSCVISCLFVCLF